MLVQLSPWLGLESLSCHVTKWFGIKPFPCQSEPCERELSVRVLFEEWGGGLAGGVADSVCVCLGGGYWLGQRIGFSRMLFSIQFPLGWGDPLLQLGQQPFKLIVLVLYINNNNKYTTPPPLLPPLPPAPPSSPPAITTTTATTTTNKINNVIKVVGRS